MTRAIKTLIAIVGAAIVLVTGYVVFEVAGGNEVQAPTSESQILE